MGSGPRLSVVGRTAGYCWLSSDPSSGPGPAQRDSFLLGGGWRYVTGGASVHLETIKLPASRAAPWRREVRNFSGLRETEK